jgi:hypothetical protein
MIKHQQTGCQLRFIHLCYCLLDIIIEFHFFIFSLTVEKLTVLSGFHARWDGKGQERRLCGHWR